jgi:hypothetical protein
MKPRTVRSVSTLWWAVGSSVATIGWTALAVRSTNARVAGIVFAVLFLVMTWRAWVAGIRVEADGVTVVGFLRSQRVAWKDIDHFAVLPLGGYPYVGHAVLRDGRQLATYGIGAPGRPRRERFRLQVQGPVDQLNAALEQWQADHGVVLPGAGARQD